MNTWGWGLTAEILQHNRGVQELQLKAWSMLSGLAGFHLESMRRMYFYRNGLQH